MSRKKDIEEILISEFSNGTEFTKEDLAEEANGIPKNTVYRILPEIVDEYSECFEVDERRPFMYKLSSPKKFKEELKDSYIPDFLQKEENNQ